MRALLHFLWWGHFPKWVCIGEGKILMHPEDAGGMLGIQKGTYWRFKCTICGTRREQKL